MTREWKDEIRDTVRSSAPDSVVACLDMTSFKLFNIVAGHAEGDRVLERLLAYLDETTSAAWRIGGDEFLALLEDGGTAGAAKYLRALSWLFHIRFGATEAWRITFENESGPPLIPWRSMTAVTTPRCGFAEVGENFESALDLAVERLDEHATAARKRPGAVLDSGPWSGFAPLIHGWLQEHILAERVCPRCGCDAPDVRSEDLGQARESCSRCGAAYDRTNVLVTLGERSRAGYS